MAKTQFEAIKQHLKKYKKITSWDAIQKYGVTRLGQYIYLLRKSNWKIKTINKTVNNRFNHHSNIAIYKLIQTA